MSVDDLLGFTKSELLAMAREAGLRGRSRMTKAELATALGDQAREAAPSDTGDDEGELRVVAEVVEVLGSRL